MTATEDKIIQFLTQKANEAWRDGQPYFLSYAGPDLAAEEIDYKADLNGERLKEFVDRTSGEGKYQLVKHPLQKAKVGVIPYGATFQFEKSEAVETASSRVPARVSSQGNTLLAFLKLLAELPAEDSDGVIIPTRVLIKLAKRQ